MSIRTRGNRGVWTARLWKFKVHVYIHIYLCVCVCLRILSVFFRPPEAAQMNEALDQVSRAILPSMCCSLPRGILSSVSARPLGEEEVRRGRVALVRKKKMKRVRHDRRVINHKILQAVFVDLPAPDGRNQRNGLD